MFGSIRSRLTGTYVVLISFTILVLGITTYFAQEEFFVETLKENLSRILPAVEGHVEPFFSGSITRQELQDTLSRIAEESRIRITVITAAGEVVADSGAEPESMENHATRPEIASALRGSPASSIRFSRTLGKNMLYTALPVAGPGGVHGVIRAAVPMERVDKSLMRLRLIWFSIALGVLLLTVKASSSFARRLTDPINHIIDAARKIKDGDFDRDLYVNRRDEIGQLAGDINHMAQELQKTMREIKDRSSQLEAVLSNMVSGVLVLDTKGFIRIVNPAAEAILGVEAEDILNRHNLEVLRSYAIFDTAHKVLTQKKAFNEEWNISIDEEKTIEVFFAPIKGENESISGVLVVLHDITRIRRLEKMRTEFVGNVSHELRTPLTAINGYVETLLDGAYEDPETCVRFLQVVERESRRLTNLIEDLLDLSRIESRVKLTRTNVDLPRLVNEVILFLEEKKRRKGIRLCRDFPNRMEPLRADKGWLEQVFINLLDNSLKYTPEGGTITVRMKDLPDAVRVDIIDTGIGIPKEHLPRIFERFYRVDKARSRQMGGTGLGLAIVKHVIEAHGGTVSAESEPGSGTVITFTIPRREL